jgi:hypothetical protein
MRSIRAGKTGVDVMRNSDNGGAWFSGCVVCGSVWDCPVCAAKVSEERREELRQAIANHDGEVLMLTYTLSHRYADDLEDVLTVLQRAKRRFKSGRAYQREKQLLASIGSISGWEVTYGENGWHPHVHELVFVHRDVTPKFARQIGRQMSLRWAEIVEKEGGWASSEIGLDVKFGDKAAFDYVAKFGKFPEDAEAWNLDAELTKSNQKIAKKNGRTPWALLDDYDSGDAQAGALFREYSAAFHGKRQLIWSAGLRDLLLPDDEAEQTDEEAAEQPEDEQSEIFLHIPVIAWREVIRVAGRRAWVLELARKGERERLQTFLTNIQRLP